MKSVRLTRVFRAHVDRCLGTGTVDIYLTNGSTIRLIPARNVFPSSDPNRSTSGAEMLGGNASNSNRARSGELDEATLQAAQRELASLHVPGSRAAAIVKEIKVSRCHSRAYLLADLRFCFAQTFLIECCAGWQCFKRGC